MYCSHCGKTIKDDYTFCAFCGTKSTDQSTEDSATSQEKKEGQGVAEQGLLGALFDSLEA